MKSLLEFSVYSRWTFTAYIRIVVAGGVNMTILEKLYDGEIIPSETAVPDTEEYQEKLREKKRLAEKIKNALPAEKSDLVNGSRRSVYLLQWMSADAPMPRVYASESTS